MADRNLRIRMIFDAADRVSRPIRDMAQGSGKLKDRLKATRDELKAIGKAQNDIAGFRQLKAGLASTGTALDAARKRTTELGRDMARAQTPTRAMTREFAKAKAEVQRLERQQQRESRQLAELRERMRAAGISTRDLARHERELRDRAAGANRELAEQERRLRRVAEREQRMERARESFGGARERAGGFATAGAGSLGIAVAIGAPVAVSAKKAMDLEEGMAGVAKVTGLAGRELDAMTSRIVDMSTRIPMAAVELSAIAAAAGSAGVGMDRFGRPLASRTEDILAFTDSAARMGIAFDMSAEDAGSTMAKWRQAFKMPQSEVEALSDRINALTNRFGGKPVAVAEIVTRVGPLGEVAGLLAPQAAAFASSLSSIGVESDVASTGIKNTLLALIKGENATKSQTKAFDALGLSAEKVAKNMQVDASGTIVDVFERIAKLKPEKQAAMLEQLFGSESIAAIAPLLTNLDGLKTRLGLVAEKSQYAGSMTAEFLARINTTKGVTDLAANGFQAVNTGIGQSLLPMIKTGALRFAAIALRMRAFATRHPEIVSAAAKIAVGLAILFGILGIGGLAIAAIMGPIAILNAGLIATGAAGGLASIGLAPILGIAAAVVLGIAALAMVAIQIYNHWDGITAWFAGLWTGMKNIVSSAMAWFDALPSRFAAFGRNIVMGMVSGITGSLDTLKSTIVGAASSAATWFKQKLGIHSPSRVFMGLGGHVMSGLTNGIAAGEDGPIGRLNALSRKMTAAVALGAAAPAMAMPTPTTPAASAEAARALGAAQRQSGPITIHIHPPAGANADDIARAVRAELARAQAGTRSNRASYADRPDWD